MGFGGANIDWSKIDKSKNQNPNIQAMLEASVQPLHGRADQYSSLPLHGSVGDALAPPPATPLPAHGRVGHAPTATQVRGTSASPWGANPQGGGSTTPVSSALLEGGNIQQTAQNQYLNQIRGTSASPWAANAQGGAGQQLTRTPDLVDGGSLQQAIQEQYASQLQANAASPWGANAQGGGWTPEVVTEDSGQVTEDLPTTGTEDLPTTGVNLGGGGSGGAMATAVNGLVAPTDQTAKMNETFSALEGTVRDEFGNLVTKDFTEDIRNAIQEGRIGLRDLNQEQLLALQESEQRRMGQIGDIQTDLQTGLQQQDQYRQDIQRQVADTAAQRAGQMTSDQTARVDAARTSLGPQVTSEFEEVAALTGALTGSQALSTTAGMDRLAQVANQGAAERLAIPAQLAAEAQMAVGDEKFRIEQQLQQQLSAGLADLNMQEQNQVLQEAMRQEQFGVEKNQALATAMMDIASKRAMATMGESQRLEDVALRQGEILQGQAFQASEQQKQRDFSAQQAAIARSAAATAQANQTAEQKQAIIDAAEGAVITAQKMGLELSNAEATAMIKAGTYETWLGAGMNENERVRIAAEALELETLKGENELALFALENPVDSSAGGLLRAQMPDITDTAFGWANQWYKLDGDEVLGKIEDVYSQTDAMGSTTYSSWAEKEKNQILLAVGLLQEYEGEEKLLVDQYNNPEKYPEFHTEWDPMRMDTRSASEIREGSDYNTLNRYRLENMPIGVDRQRQGMK